MKKKSSRPIPAPYTPGPWTLRLEDHNDCPVIQVMGLGDVRVAEIPFYTGLHPEDDGDARLISAAPDLLAALKAVMSEADGGWMKESVAAHQCRLAIDKAEGRKTMSYCFWQNLLQDLRGAPDLLDAIPEGRDEMEAKARCIKLFRKINAELLPEAEGRKS